MCGTEYKKIALIGATGFLGNALIPFLLKEYNPDTIRLLGRSEFKLAQIIRGQGATYNLERFRPLICDIRDRERVFSCLQNCDLVIHTAAMKRLEICQANSQECVKTNVLGSLHILDACLNVGVGKLVAISSDKACNAVNLYGRSKALMESMILDRARQLGTGKPTMCCVRYGNVAMSTGSLLTFWLDRVKCGECLPLTDPRCTRFIMTKRMALDVVKDAIDNGKQGELILPKELYAINIKRIAEILIKYYKSKSKIIEIGLYKDEKLAEDLDDGIRSDDPKYQLSDEKFLNLLQEEGAI